MTAETYFSRRMLVIGIVGGVASGKSLAAEIFQQLGCERIDADSIGHEVLAKPEVIEVLKNRWPSLISSDGQIVRPLLADHVFRANDSRKNLEFLESLVHPIIEAEVDQKIRNFKKSGIMAVVLDAPLLLEKGWQKKCNKIVFVDSPSELRKERAIDRGWLPDEIIKREQSQMDIQTKKTHATDLISNSSDLNLLKTEIFQLLTSWGIIPH